MSCLLRPMAGKTTLYQTRVATSFAGPFVAADMIQRDELRDPSMEASYRAASIAEARRVELLEAQRGFATEILSQGQNGHPGLARDLMSNASAKKLSVTSVKVLHDLLLAHFTSRPGEVPGDTEAAQHVLTILGMKLAEIGYERATTMPAVIRSHNAAVARGTLRYLADAADDAVALLFRALANTELKRPLAAPVGHAPAGNGAARAAAAGDAGAAAPDAPRACRGGIPDRGRGRCRLRRLRAERA